MTAYRMQLRLQCHDTRTHVYTMQHSTGTVLVVLVALFSQSQSSLLVTAKTAQVYIHLLHVQCPGTFARTCMLQSSSVGCSSAYYMLTNSIPKSCNAALHRTITSLPNSSQPVDSGDICTSYCLTPLKQAALECQTIDELYSAISSRCCWNDYGEQ